MWGICVGLWEGCWVDRMVETNRGADRGPYTMCSMSAQWGSIALGDMGREDFETFWGSCRDGGGRERIWSRVARKLCGDVVVALAGSVGWGFWCRFSGVNGSAEMCVVPSD